MSDGADFERMDRAEQQAILGELRAQGANAWVYEWQRAIILHEGTGEIVHLEQPYRRAWFVRMFRERIPPWLDEYATNPAYRIIPRMWEPKP